MRGDVLSQTLRSLPLLFFLFCPTRKSKWRRHKNTGRANLAVFLVNTCVRRVFRAKHQGCFSLHQIRNEQTKQSHLSYSAQHPCMWKRSSSPYWFWINHKYRSVSFNQINLNFNLCLNWFQRLQSHSLMHEFTLSPFNYQMRSRMQMCIPAYVTILTITASFTLREELDWPDRYESYAGLYKPRLLSSAVLF